MTNGKPPEEAMAWIFRPLQGAYITSLGTHRCRVWREHAGTWSAMVSREGAATTHDSFPTAEAAMAWCDDYVRQASV